MKNLEISNGFWVDETFTLGDKKQDTAVLEARKKDDGKHDVLFPQSNTSINSILEKLAAMQAEIDELKTSVVPVGTIILSSLELKEFKKSQKFGRWELCDGKTYKKFKTPDLRGRFAKFSDGSKKSGEIENSGVSADDIQESVEIKSEYLATTSHFDININPMEVLVCENKRNFSWNGENFTNESQREVISLSIHSDSITKQSNAPSVERYQGHDNYVFSNGFTEPKSLKKVGQHAHKVTGESKLKEKVKKETQPKACYLNAFCRVS